jgi:signal transduction histidine kinase
MSGWVRGLPALALVVVLVAGGLGWATHAALDMERRQLDADARHDFAERLRRAMWRLDARLVPALAREEGRPFAHYSALYPPPAAGVAGRPARPGEVLLPSPLLTAELPDWMVLHFQSDPNDGWRSPQASAAGRAVEADARLADLRKTVTPDSLFARVADRPPAAGEEVALAPAPANYLTQGQSQQLNGTNGYRFARNTAYGPGNEDDLKRANLANTVLNESQSAFQKELENYTQLSGEKGRPAWRLERVRVGAFSPVWLPGGRIALVRPAWLGDRAVTQGVLLDWPRLRAVLLDEVHDLFPGADLVPLTEGEPAEADRAMATLPVRFVPGPVPVPPDPGWSPLRVGLALAWAAALVALAAVALGGWSLLDLSERRIRFVSAVTHELRTPLTTLRLYLDLLTSGLVRDETHRAEYLTTMAAESERLHRLVGNVLDFARLERQRPVLQWQAVPAGDLVRRVSADWQSACEHAGKRLEVEMGTAADIAVRTDPALAAQVLGTLIDNACKHARGADDPAIRLHAVREGHRLVLEVEDGGPGVGQADRRRIFRAFGRGNGVTAGGVGLGLALARRWTGLLGGRLSVVAGRAGRGACFRLELPLGRGAEHDALGPAAGQVGAEEGRGRQQNHTQDDQPLGPHSRPSLA